MNVAAKTNKKGVLDYFYPAATDDTYSSTARTSANHRDILCYVPLSSNEHKDLFNLVKHLKTFTGFAEIAKSKSLGESPELTGPL